MIDGANDDDEDETASRRLCGSCPNFAPPGREFSRFSFLSVEGGFDELREVLSGC